MEKGNNVTPLFDNQSEELLTYAECAEKLRVTVSALQRMVHRRQLPFLKVGPRQVRFIWKDVMEAIKKGGYYGSQNKVR